MNTKPLQSLLLLTLGAALLPLAGQAKPEDAPRDGMGAPPRPAKIIRRLDADGSGTISSEEAKGRLAEHFEKIDADGDGEITKQELAQSRKELKGKAREAGKRLKDADTDGNGAISADEASEGGLERLAEHFDQIDADGDGEISRAEMREMAKQAKQKKRREGQDSE